MRRSAALFTIALALGAMILAPRSAARADGREEGPFEIEKCQTIDKPGSYKLVRNITFTLGPPFVCLSITASFVTVDLGGFSISAPGAISGTGIEAPAGTLSITVRNGSIAGFLSGVDLGGEGSIVEGLRVSGRFRSFLGIGAVGIVKGNTVFDFSGVPGQGTGISASGVVTGNYVFSNGTGMSISVGSTVIGNTSVNNLSGFGGIVVNCPSNVTDNTAVNNVNLGSNLVLQGEGCTNTNNVAP